MEENYVLVANLNKDKVKEYVEKLKKKELDIIINNENYIYARKANINNENYEKEKEVIESFIHVLKKYENHGELYLNITSEIDYVIKNNVQNILKEGVIRWMIRQSITKAIIENKKQITDF